MQGASAAALPEANQGIDSGTAVAAQPQTDLCTAGWLCAAQRRSAHQGRDGR